MRLILAVLSFVTLVVLYGCGGGGGSSPGSDTGPVVQSTTYSISGKTTLNGTGLSGVTVTLTPTGGDSTSIITDSTGNFIFTGTANGSYTVSAAMTGYTMSASQSVTVNNANVSDIDFTATVVPPATYAISGTVTLNGTGLSGVTVTLSGSNSVSITTASDGTFTFTGVQNGSYTVSAAMSGYTMSASQSVTVNSGDVSNIGFTATAVPPATYSVSGKVTLKGSGFGLCGVVVTLSGSSSTSVTTASDGTFTFNGVQNGSYTLSAAKRDYTMSASQPVTVNNANISGIQFTAKQGGS